MTKKLVRTFRESEKYKANKDFFATGTGKRKQSEAVGKDGGNDAALATTKKAPRSSGKSRTPRGATKAAGLGPEEDGELGDGEA